MITIIYDANFGLSIADGKVLEYVDSMIDFHNTDPQKKIEYHVSTSLVIHAMRLAIKQGKIPNTLVLFQYKDHCFHADEHGRFEKWTEGFCDIWENIIISLI